MIQAAPMNHVIIYKQFKPYASMFRLIFFYHLIDSSRMEIFRALTFSFRVIDFRVRKFSNLGSFRALKLSDCGSFMVRKYSIRVLTFKGPKTLPSGEFQGPKSLHSDDRIYIIGLANEVFSNTTCTLLLWKKRIKNLFSNSDFFKPLTQIESQQQRTLKPYLTNLKLCILAYLINTNEQAILKSELQFLRKQDISW